MLAQLLEYDQDEDAAGAVNRQPWAMQGAAVDEHALVDEAQCDLPHPADDAEDEEHHYQVQQRVAACRVQPAYVDVLVLHGDGGEAYRVHLRGQQSPAGLRRVHLALVILPG